MASKRLTTFIVIFNVVMAFFLFLSSQFVLFILNGTVVQGVGIYIDYGFPYTGAPIPTQHAPLLNYPLFVFIFTLIGNAIFIGLLRREKKAELRSKTNS
jgi:hypothetical protein